MVEQVTTSVRLGGHTMYCRASARWRKNENIIIITVAVVVVDMDDRVGLPILFLFSIFNMR